MTGSRALLRLAWRDARRDRWRTVLVVALVALPVALLGGAITSFESVAASPEDRARDLLGQADAVVHPSEAMLADAAEPARVRERLAAELPAGTTIEAQTSVGDELVLPGERVEVLLSDAPVDGEHLGVGSYRLRHGRAPAAADQVVLTEALAESLEVSVGDGLTFTTLGDVEVVGIVRRLEYLAERAVLLEPGSLTAADPPFPLDEVNASLRLLVRLPEGGANEGADPIGALGWGSGPVAVDGDEAPDWSVTTRDDVLAQRFTDGERWLAVIVGGLAVVEVALIVGAAFAVSVRRRQRELGLLAAVGATTTHVRRAVLLTGLVAGALGAVIGTLLGLAASVAAFPWFDDLANREVSTLRADPLWLGSVAAIGVVSTLLGAWWPARSVAGLPVTVALSGRRPPPRRSIRGLGVGLVVVLVASLVLVGAVVSRANSPYVFLLGSILLVLGAGLTSPWLLEQLGRVAPRLPVGPRLAVRDAARFRTRNGPIVTAAMAGLAGAIAIATVVTSMERHEAQSYTPRLGQDQVIVHGQGGPEIAERIVAEFGGRYARTGSTNVSLEALDADADEHGRLFGVVALGDPELADILGGAAAVAALDRGEVVLIGHEADRVAVLIWDEDAQREVELAELPATQVAAPEGVQPGAGMLPSALLPRGLADEVSSLGDAVLLELPDAVDDQMHDRMVALAANATVPAFVESERGYRSPYAVVLLVVLAVGAVTGLALVAVAVALAATEARGDLRTLTAVGADRATRRSLAAGRALLLSGLGGVLAVPVGLVPGAAVLLRMSHVPLAVPWAAIALIVVAVPLLATLGAALASRRDPGPSLRVVA